MSQREILKEKGHLRNLTFEKGKGKCTWQKKSEALRVGRLNLDSVVNGD